MRNKKKAFVIAIDGPAGSGKSTVSKRIAKRLGLLYVDTGAMYRALTLKAMRKRLNLEEERGLVSLAKATKIDLIDNDGDLKVLLDSEDVTGPIRRPEVTTKVKYIARVPGVREEMVKLQRSIGKRHGGAVLEGRDIGTVVFPDADYKFYLDAELNERTRRRHKELEELGQKIGPEEIREDIVTRDETDMKRSVGALKKAGDAIFIDTTNLSIDEVVEKILGYIK